MEKPINTGIHQPEEWEDYKENTGVINPFHDVDQEDTLFHRCASSASITTPLPRSIGSSNYSTTSLSSPSPNFPINSHLNQTNSHLPSPSPTPTPSYKLHDPLLTTISPSHSITSPTQPKTKTNPNPNSNPKTTRIPRLPSRGIPHINPSTQKNWQPILQSYLSYSFLNPDILEEALETPKNGVTSVGTTRRICMDGNAGMAKLGEMVMRLVLREQFYLFSIPHAQAAQITNRVLSRHSLNAYPTIASCIRPQPYIPVSFRNIIELVKEDTREDSTRAISRAVKAVIGAVYLDGGIENAKKVMENLQMGIKLPPGSRE
ncbi:hypothetical protein sscle_05g044070 [Sclerotinia sclerotiorum 1980 UF-70]|uniref:RNase III domain-containing protein n=1 Tax=Sclerotinia sclerotiorum (strain ATCC 18683 / 1980 / Ss-1) TaxID=665079 RepID=A0A1D9Q3Y4_SCLS1|nr:hypothetical protein sscle_05g044070 [Sclerotinia sclerotiorum 1980 UF-70]